MEPSTEKGLNAKNKVIFCFKTEICESTELGKD
jgi:hypothetical protein